MIQPSSSNDTAIIRLWWLYRILMLDSSTDGSMDDKYDGKSNRH